MELVPVLLLCAAGLWFGWKIYSGYRDGPNARSSRQRAQARPQPSPHSTGTSSQQQRAPQITEHHWENDGYRDVEVVGESHYQPYLKKIVGTPNDNGVSVACVAHLIPEPSNQYDRNAVRIDIDGVTVGYLTKVDAILFHQRLADNGLQGVITSCSAMIFGGKKVSGSRTPYGVWLEMKRL